MKFLQELLRIAEDESEEEVVSAKDLDVDDEVHNKLDIAAEEDSVDTQCFGLETEDGKVVKVYVAVDDAEGFEAAMSKRLGETEDLKTALEELEKEFDIIDVVWPDEDDEDDEDDKDEDDKDDGVDPNTEDGSDSLNPAVDYDDSKKESAPTLTLGQRFSKRLTEFKVSRNEEPVEKTDDKEDNPSDEESEDDKPAKTKPPTTKVPSSRVDWVITKNKKGSTLLNSYFQIDLDMDETMDLVNKMSDKQIARFKDDEGKISYVFSPRGDGYILKTPEFQSGFRLSKSVVDEIISEE